MTHRREEPRDKHIHLLREVRGGEASKEIIKIGKLWRLRSLDSIKPGVS